MNFPKVLYIARNWTIVHRKKKMYHWYIFRTGVSIVLIIIITKYYIVAVAELGGRRDWSPVMNFLGGVKYLKTYYYFFFIIYLNIIIVLSYLDILRPHNIKYIMYNTILNTYYIQVFSNHLIRMTTTANFYANLCDTPYRRTLEFGEIDGIIILHNDHYCYLLK